MCILPCCRGQISSSTVLKLLGHIAMHIRVQMAIKFKCGLYLFVPQALRHGQDRKAHVNEQTGVRMAEIMHTNFLDAGFFAACTQLRVYPAFCKRKQPICWVVVQEPVSIVLNNSTEEIRQSNIALAFWRFWLVNDFLAIGHCKVFGNMQHLV